MADLIPYPSLSLILSVDWLVDSVDPLDAAPVEPLDSLLIVLGA